MNAEQIKENIAESDAAWLGKDPGDTGPYEAL